MDTSVVPVAGSFQLDIDSGLRSITGISWASSVGLALIHDGLAMASDGLLQFLTMDLGFRDAGGRLVYAPQTLVF